jgi:hypothetical protein
MINVTVRTNDSRTRTPAEVKRLLHDMAFVLKASQRMKMEIVEARQQTVRPVRSLSLSRTTSPTALASCDYRSAGSIATRFISDGCGARHQPFCSRIH